MESSAIPRRIKPRGARLLITPAVSEHAVPGRSHRASRNCLTNCLQSNRIVPPSRDTRSVDTAAILYETTAQGCEPAGRQTRQCDHGSHGPPSQGALQGSAVSPSGRVAIHAILVICSSVNRLFRIGRAPHLEFALVAPLRQNVRLPGPVCRDPRPPPRTLHKTLGQLTGWKMV